MTDTDDEGHDGLDEVEFGPEYVEVLEDLRDGMLAEETAEAIRHKLLVDEAFAEFARQVFGGIIPPGLMSG